MIITTECQLIVTNQLFVCLFFCLNTNTQFLDNSQRHCLQNKHSASEGKIGFFYLALSSTWWKQLITRLIVGKIGNRFQLSNAQFDNYISTQLLVRFYKFLNQIILPHFTKQHSCTILLSAVKRSLIVSVRVFTQNDAVLMHRPPFFPLFTKHFPPHSQFLESAIPDEPPNVGSNFME